MTAPFPADGGVIAPGDPPGCPTRRAAPPVGAVVDGYRLVAPIGSGGLSWVYLGEPLAGGGQVAIKLLRGAFANLPGFVKRFEHEARVCRRLDHPRCVRLFDHGSSAGIPYLVMEYIRGRTLDQLLSAGPVPTRRTVDILLQILDGLAHAHGCGVVHRDLKPGNVMVLDDGRVKVLDFGTARILGGEDGAAGRGLDVGSPSYMAPEQMLGKPTDHRTDLYAAGVMLFELLTAKRPFEAADPATVLRMHLRHPIPSPRALRPDLGLSPELEGVIVRAMQKRPEERFVDAHAFAVALASCRSNASEVLLTRPRPLPVSPRKVIR